MRRTAEAVREKIRQGLAQDARSGGAPQRVHVHEVAVGAVRALPRIPGLLEAAWVAMRSDRERIDSIGARLEKNAQEAPHSTALRFEEIEWSHAELNERVNRVARALEELGIGSGSSVAVFLENRPELILVVAALAKLGAVAALLNTNQRGAVLAHSIEVAACSHALVGEELWEAFAEVRRRVGLSGPEKVAWVADEPGALGDAETGARRVGQKAEFPQRIRGPRSATDLVRTAAQQSSLSRGWTLRVPVGAPCFHIFTSGTTGLPKASIMTHQRWIKAGTAFGKGALGLRRNHCVYVPLPLYHNQALTVGWGAAVMSGATFAFRRRFSASAFWPDCIRFGADAIIYIGELPRYLLNQPPGPLDREHRVRGALGNGLKPEIWRPFKERFGIDNIVEIYAASEANTAFLNVFNLEGTVGICPSPHAVVRYDVAAGKPARNRKGWMERVKVSETGLLIVKVNERFQFDGYTDARASEAKLLRDVFTKGDVWFDTGDLLRRLGWGHLAFVDRIGDTFRWKAENVSTTEVELVLNQFPGVEESTIYGVEVPGNEGRAGMAALSIQGNAEAFDFEGLVRHLQASLPAYARPLFLRMQEGLQTTATFKHQKGALRDEGWAASVPVWVLWPGAHRYERLELADHARLATTRW